MRTLCFVILLCATTAALAGDPQRLTENGRLKFSPFFRHEGREIIFVELTDPTIYRLQKLTLKDGSIQPLHAEANTSEFEPFSAEDGEAYGYLKTRGALSVSLMLRDGQGSVLGEILPEDGFCGYRHPTVSRGKSLLAFSYAEKGMQQIYSSKLNGTERRMLTESQGLNHWPAFSPDGTSIAFGSSRDGNFEIYVMRADGSHVRRLTDHPLQDMRPRFSPDGKRIAFTSHRDGNAEIYVMDADGSNLQRITNHPERDDYAEWHPDGARLVVVSERSGRHDLYLVDVPK
jgi:WD40 repeat protein